MRPGELLHVAGPVWLVWGQRNGYFPRCHGVLIRGRGETCLIDPGCGPEVVAELARNESIDLVLNSHTHPDHCAGNYLLAGREIWVPEVAWEVAGVKARLAPRFARPGPLAAHWEAFVSEAMGFVDQRPTGSFRPGQVIQVGGVAVEAVATPGHTVDHTCFWLPREGILLASDYDLTSFGPWYGHAESDLGQLRAGLERIIALEPRVLVSSHKPPLAEGITAALRAFDAIVDQRSQRLLDFLAQPRSEEEIVDASLIYGGFKAYVAMMRYWEGEMIRRHLEPLVAQGAVTRREDGRYQAPIPAGQGDFQGRMG